MLTLTLNTSAPQRRDTPDSTASITHSRRPRENAVGIRSSWFGGQERIPGQFRFQPGAGGDSTRSETGLSTSASDVPDKFAKTEACPPRWSHAVTVIDQISMRTGVNRLAKRTPYRRQKGTPAQRSVTNAITINPQELTTEPIRVKVRPPAGTPQPGDTTSEQRAT